MFGIMTTAYTLFRRMHDANGIKSDTCQQPTHFMSHNKKRTKFGDLNFFSSCSVSYHFAFHVIVIQQKQRQREDVICLNQILMDIHISECLDINELFLYCVQTFVIIVVTQKPYFCILPFDISCV